MVAEKEFLVSTHSINNIRHYNNEYPIIMHIDHVSIKYLMKKPITNGMVTRWLILLQELDITILEKIGKDNVVIDFLSRIKTNENEPLVKYRFQYEHLFTASTNSPQFVYIDIFLAIGKLPHHLTPKE
jgi:hypothetical protein